MKLFILFFTAFSLQVNAEKLCLDWQQTNFPGSCARTGLLLEGQANVNVNQVPVPFYTASAPIGHQQSFRGCFDKIHLLLGENHFHFQVSIGDPEGLYGLPTPKQDYCTHMYHTVMLKLPNGENILLFGVTHAGSAVDGKTKINFSLSKIDPQLAAEIERVMQELRSQLDQIEKLNSGLAKPDDIERQEQELNRLDQQVRQAGQAEAELSNAANRALEELNAIRARLPNRNAIIDEGKLLKKLYQHLQNVHSGPVGALTIRELVQLIKDNHESFQTRQLWHLSDLVGQVAEKANGPKAAVKEATEWFNFQQSVKKNELDKKLGEYHARSRQKENLGAEALYELAQKSLATLQKTVSGNDVIDRPGFLKAYHAWIAEQVLVSKLMASNPNLCRDDLVALERTNQEIKIFISRFFDEQSGWFRKSNVPADLKAAVNQLISINALRGKELREALNLWSNTTDLTPQQVLVADTLQALISGYQATKTGDDTDIEGINSYNKLLLQGIDSVKKTATLSADIGVGFVPFVGDFKDFCEATTGKRLCVPNGEDLSHEDRVYAAIGMIAGSGSFWKGISSLVKESFKGLSNIINKRFLADREHWKLAKSLRFTGKTSQRMSEPERHVPVHMLAEAIRTGKVSPDPQKVAGAVKYVHEMIKNGKSYILEVIYRKSDKTVLHFHYERKK